MNHKTEKVQSFTDLKVWQAGHKLVVKTYAMTEDFSSSDRFGLSSQMQRSAVSVTSNIAEGFGRQAKNDKKHFYIMARASLTELQNQLLIARDTGKITDKDYEETNNVSIEAHKLLHGLIKSTNNRVD